MFELCLPFLLFTLLEKGQLEVMSYLFSVSEFVSDFLDHQGIALNLDKLPEGVCFTDLVSNFLSEPDSIAELPEDQKAKTINEIIDALMVGPFNEPVDHAAIFSVYGLKDGIYYLLHEWGNRQDIEQAVDAKGSITPEFVKALNDAYEQANVKASIVADKFSKIIIFHTYSGQQPTLLKV